MQIKPSTAYHYSDICLIPQRGILSTRSNADTSVKLGKRTFRLPVFPSNMACTINSSLAKDLASEGYFYIMHRCGDSGKFIDTCLKDNYFTSISVGIKDEDRKFIENIKNSYPNNDIDYITIDVAHGHSLQTIKMVEFVKTVLPNVFLIAGNIATAAAAFDLKNAGADAVKVGIGQGNACITKDKTGFTVPMFTCVRDVYEENVGIPIIADGGIKSNGDIAKAIVAGADMVMCGSLFAECVDSPSEIFEDSTGQSYKLYYGSASEYNKFEKKHIEGVLKRIPQNSMTYSEKMKEILQDLSSSISYSGGSCLKSLKGSIKFYATKR